MLINDSEDLLPVTVKRVAETTLPLLKELTEQGLVAMLSEIAEESEQMSLLVPVHDSLCLPASEASQKRLTPSHDNGSHRLSNGNSSRNCCSRQSLPFPERSCQILVRDGEDISPEAIESSMCLQQLLPSGEADQEVAACPSDKCSLDGSL
jgi:hypothetical protein